MGEMRRATAREEQERKNDRFASTLVIEAEQTRALSVRIEAQDGPQQRMDRTADAGLFRALITSTCNYIHHAVGRLNTAKYV